MTTPIPPSLQTERIAHLCQKLKDAQTRMERERILAELAEVIRAPTSRSMFGEGL